MHNDCSVADYIKNKHTYIPIDVRTPNEFLESRIPHAVNVPLFSDKERAEIGTIYKQEGKKLAKWRAMEVVSPKLPTILGEIKKWEQSGKQPLVYCWRGGLRSQSVAIFAELSGLSIQRLEGGYRAYREYVVEQIPKLLPEKAVVIDGMTGTGKTLILHKLKERGYPVLDLERYANHKGSVFGALSGEPPHNQKMFDALLFDDLLEMAGSHYFIMEGESKRIGHAVQPPELYEKKMKGIHIRVHGSIEKRVERIFKEYVASQGDLSSFKERVKEALKWIMKRLHPIAIREEIMNALEKENFQEMIYLLITYYYDPRYENKINEVTDTALQLSSDSLEDATDQIAEFIDKHVEKKVFS